MGWLAGLLSLGITLILGVVFALVGALLAAMPVRWITARLQAPEPSFKRAYQVSLITYFCGLLSGSLLQLTLGGPSPLTSALGVIVHVILFSLLLRRMIGQPYVGWKGFGQGMAVGLVSTLFSCAVILGSVWWFKH